MALFGNGGNRLNEQNRGNQTGRLGLMAVVAAYIIYLGVGLIRSGLKGEEGMPVWAAWLFGIFFIVAGAGYMVFLYRQYKMAKALEEEEASAAAEEADAIEEHAAEEAALEENQTDGSAVDREDEAERPIEDKE